MDLQSSLGFGSDAMSHPTMEPAFTLEAETGSAYGSESRAADGLLEWDTAFMGYHSCPVVGTNTAGTISESTYVQSCSCTTERHVCEKQRRSRHDPGGGISQPAILHTPQVSAHPSSAMQMAV